MIEGPIGAAAFNNEFGRPSTVGYFRVFEQPFDQNKAYGYHKPIMLAGGIGEIKDRNSIKNPISVGDLVVVLGGACNAHWTRRWGCILDVIWTK